MIERAFAVLLLIVILSVQPLRDALFPKMKASSYTSVKQRHVFGDVLKGVAILGVIVIHVGHIHIAANGFNNDMALLSILNNLARFSLPFFFILSGIFLYLPSYKAKDIGTFFWRKMVRIFIPYVFFTAVIVEALGLPLRSLPGFIVSGEALVPYYFITILFQLYLVYPLLLPFRKSRKALVIVFVLSFASYIFLPISFGIVPFAGRFLFLFFYGMYMRDAFLSESKVEVQSWVAVAFLYIFFMLAALLIDIQQSFFFNARFFFGLAMFHIFWAAKRAILKEVWLSRTLASFGKYSLWIYLLHYIIIGYLYQLGVIIGAPYYVLYITLIFLAAGVSYIIARVVDHFYTYVARIVYVSTR